MPDKKSLWATLKERLDSIGALANAMKQRRKKKPAGPAKIRTQRKKTPKPKPSPQQEEYLRQQREKENG